MSGNGPFYGRDHPMKPSAVQGTVHVPLPHGEVLLEMARERERGSERDKEKEQKTSVLFQPRCSGSTKGEIIRRIEEMKQ